MRNGYAKCVTYRTGKVTGLVRLTRLVSKKSVEGGVTGKVFPGDDMFVGGRIGYVPPVLLRGGVPWETHQSQTAGTEMERQEPRPAAVEAQPPLETRGVSCPSGLRAGLPAR